jgi:hypothetical protein
MGNAHVSSWINEMNRYEAQLKEDCSISCHIFVSIMKGPIKNEH